MRTQHTPGPWNFRRDTGYIHDHDGDGRIVATATYGFRSNEENEANSRLISAAPELLAALKRLFATINHPGIPGAEGSVIEVARAAIAKAQGHS